MVSRYDFFTIEEVNKIIDVLLNEANINIKQDLKQELYLKYLEITMSRNLDKIKNKSGYIFKCLKNKMQEYLKKEKFISSRLVKFDEEVLLSKQKFDTIHSVVLDFSKLTSMEKQLFYDYFVMGYTQKEIATRRKTSQQQIQYQLIKIKSKLKNSQ